VSAARILVVEDSPTQAEAVRILLEGGGYRVAVARSGEEALECVERDGYDLVLSDVLMPGISGYELCRRIKDRLGQERAPRVVLLTSLSDPRDIVRGLESGADNYVTKPYEPDYLLDRIENVLENREIRRADRDGEGITVRFMDETFTITAEREQVLELLLASFAELVRTNDALQRSQRALQQANQRERAARRQAESDARRMEALAREAEAATRTRDEVLATVSHDLRNPIGTIFMSASLLLETELPAPTVQQQLEIIRRTAERMNVLLQDLLDASKMAAGQFSVAPQPERVESLLTDVRDLLEPLAERSGVSLVEETRVGRLEVLADRARIHQVFSNLIGNAVKFTPEGGRVTVSSEREGGEIVFSVADTGSGIAPDHLPHIFDRYWQAGERKGGSGLGLAIAKGFVEAHGGRIWAESRLGRGTTFYFTLPIASVGSGRHG
jgi:two-component system, sensor histidine kinase and response regulator